MTMFPDRSPRSEADRPATSRTHEVGRNRFSTRRLLLVGALALVGGCATTAPPAPGPRPASWASAIAASPGLPNLYRVNASLYRSAQPSRAGFALLESRPSLANGDPPINTVVSLRAFNDDSSLVATPSALHLEEISFKTWHPEDEDVVKFLRIATTPALQPVLVHCRHGSDRTGTMVAVYRIVVEGWTKAQAVDEMVHGGFGFHPMWQNLLRYIDALDVDAIRAEVDAQGPWPRHTGPDATVDTHSRL